MGTTKLGCERIIADGSRHASSSDRGNTSSPVSCSLRVPNLSKPVTGWLGAFGGLRCSGNRQEGVSVGDCQVETIGKLHCR